MRWINLIFLAVVVTSFSPALSASENVLNLSDAVKAALEGNHEIRAFRSAVAAREAGVGIARSDLLPRIFFQERFVRTNNPTTSFSLKLNQERFAQSDFELSSLNDPSPINDFQTSVGFEQPLFVRKASIGLEMSKGESEAVTEEFRRKREDVAMRVVSSFLAVQTAKAFFSVSEKSLEDAREHLRIAELRHESGLALYSDTLRASTALTEAEQRKVSAAKNKDVAKRGLGLLLGSPGSVDVTDEEAVIPVRDMEHYVQASLARRDVRAMEIRHENAVRNIHLAEAGFFPVIGVGGSYDLHDHSNPFGGEGASWTLSAFLRWDLFDGMKRSFEKTMARHQATEAGEYLEGMKKAVAFRVYEAFRAVEETRTNVELARASLKTADEGRRLVRVRYESGLSPLVDLLDAQVTLDRARSNVVARQNEYVQAVANLSFESGIILRDLGLE